jgi:hypothetical protein
LDRFALLGKVALATGGSCGLGPGAPKRTVDVGPEPLDREGNTVPHTSIPKTLQDLIDRAVISDTLLAYATGVDRRDWALYRSIFCDEVKMDVSSWSPAKGTYRIDDWMAAVRESIVCFDSTAHVLTNHVITLDGDRATAVAQMTATHYLEAHLGLQSGSGRIFVHGAPVPGSDIGPVGNGRPIGEIHMIGGFYTGQLVRAGDRWKIAEWTLMVTWEQGNRGLFEKAKALGPRARIDVGLAGI